MESIEANPAFPWLDGQSASAVQEFLDARGWLNPGERVISTGKAGEGNMNLTLRVKTNTRTFIVKQARPWVEKYDHIPAPWDRSLYEQGFYQRVARIPEVAGRMPAILASDAAARALMLEDLPSAADFTTAYNGGQITTGELRVLADYLAALHRETRGDPDPEFENRAMRELNHEHIFVVPLDPANGLDLEPLEPGLAAAAHGLIHDETYRGLVTVLGARYLSDGPCLLHGDYFPGSWLRTANGVKVIDPEFCYYGDPEYDLGVAVAHLSLSKQDPDKARSFLEHYGGEFNSELVAKYAAAEIMRRLIGVAQLPIPPTQGFRAKLLERSRVAMVRGNLEALWS